MGKFFQSAQLLPYSTYVQSLLVELEVLLLEIWKVQAFEKK